MNTALLKEYQIIRQKREALEFEEAQLKSEIVLDLKKNGIEKTETEYGIFTVASRTSYTYSDKVKALEDKVKLAKIKEEEKGIAKPKVATEYLVYTQPKND